MQFNILAISGLFNIIISIYTIILVFRIWKKNFTIGYLFLLCLSTLGWASFYFLWSSGSTVIDKTLSIRIAVFFATFISTFYFLISESLKKNFKPFNLFNNLIIIISVILSLLWFTNIYISDWVYATKYHIYWPQGNIYLIVYLLFWFGLPLFSLKNYFFLEPSRSKDISISFITFGTFFGFIAGASNYVTWFIPSYTPYITAVIAFSSLFVSHAIISPRLIKSKVSYVESSIFFVVVLNIFILIFSDILAELFNPVWMTVLLNLLFGIIIYKYSSMEKGYFLKVQELSLDLKRANHQLAEIDARKSDFINIASHQLRTPTTAIKGYASLLLEGAYGGVPEKEKEIVERISGLADQNVKIIADMLNISRIEQNRMKYTFERVEIAQFILDIIHTLQLKAEGKKLPFEYTFDKELNDSLTSEKKVYANVDKTLLAQVFENVIDNAVKYTQKGGVKIDIRLAGKKLIFKCVDTGIGIDKESLNSLFKKFGRAKNAQESGIEGTGIGLYIAKEIMSKHKGDITISSEGEGKGSESIITLEVDSAESHVATVN